MVSVPVGRAVFLIVALGTHALVGYALGALLANRPYAGAVGGVAADVDLLFPAAFEWPLVHRGITHTLLAVTVATALVVARRRAAGIAFGGGYASQLLIDATTARGVPLLYPISSSPISIALPVGGHSTTGTLILWGGILAVLYANGSLPDVRSGWNDYL